ncbi:aldehyde dehydrogenase family protein [Herbiconiux sp. KACC 21604]|uniref:aldehyde dehydrogenase family protein n=1 Tax=unclassified Herbiconiux TaxID=2618217 RepID=UPI001491B9E7|nr:aldehyde dehydrogenase family protein [Herbiconiux sp. SALV-R1]QJU54978.1 aldehyde dehydrogenase family protein [Herbiconiux sp. SALV-R1]WPO86104.1 aldehyde dehydrogenase family protein [Herbiconiux sp. KACC 21604]
MRDRREQFIDGEWIPSSEPGLEVRSARTGTLVGRVAEGTIDDVERAVAAARRAFPAWSALPAGERAGYLRAIAEGIRSHADEIVTLVAEEIGTIEGTARAMQIGAAAHAFDDAAAHAEAALEAKELGNSRILSQPVGVVAAITPWNFPLYQAALKIAPALAVGCTVVLKPSEVAGLTALTLGDIAAEAGLPAGVLNIVSGLGPVVGEALVGHPEVDAVTFTGSDRAGARVASIAGGAIKPVTLELGGKSAHLVLDDSDLESAVGYSITSAFGNNGQVCAALSRLVVPRDLLPRVEEIALAKASTVVVGDPLESGTQLGPLTSEAQRERLQGLVRTAVDEGTRVLLGGPDAEVAVPSGLEGGYWVAPTVFTDVAPDATIAQEEAFGPVLTIIPFDGDDEEGVRIVNSTRYGLNAAVWAADRERAEAVARQLNASTVYLNAAAFNPSAPFGGTKGSGFGRERGAWGLHEYTQTKSVQV